MQDGSNASDPHRSEEPDTCLIGANYLRDQVATRRLDQGFVNAVIANGGRANFYRTPRVYARALPGAPSDQKRSGLRHAHWQRQQRVTSKKSATPTSRPLGHEGRTGAPGDQRITGRHLTGGRPGVRIPRTGHRRHANGAIGANVKMGSAPSGKTQNVPLADECTAGPSPWLRDL